MNRRQLLMFFGMYFYVLLMNAAADLQRAALLACITQLRLLHLHLTALYRRRIVRRRLQQRRQKWLLVHLAAKSSEN